MSGARLALHALGAVRRHRLRSAFVMLGSFVGVVALTLVLSVGQGAERKVLATVRQLFGASSILVRAGGGRHMGGPRADGPRLTLDDLRAIAAEVPGIEAWDPLRELPPTQVRRGDAVRTARVIGQSERSERVWDRGVSRGEYFDASDVAASARVALIGETVARALFGREEPLGQEVLVGQVACRVVGVLERQGTDAHGMDRDDEVVVPVSTAMRRLMNVDAISAAKLLVRDPAQVEAAAADVRRVLRERHALSADQPDDFIAMTPVQAQRMVARAQRVMFVFLPLVACASLLVGGAVASALLLGAVNERTGEIGLRRAVGARPADIHRQFLVEASITMLGGGLLGVLVGSAAAQAIAARLDLGLVLSWKAALAGAALSATTGLLAGVLPARRAAALEPAAALR